MRGQGAFTLTEVKFSSESLLAKQDSLDYVYDFPKPLQLQNKTKGSTIRYHSHLNVRAKNAYSI